MNWILICFVLGATLFHQLDALPGLKWLSLALCVPFLWRFTQLRPWLMLFIGAAWSLLHASFALQQQFPAALERSDMVLEGVVDSLPVKRGGVTFFRMQVNSLHAADDVECNISHVQLSWYGKHHNLRVGDAWRLKVRLIRPRGNQNPSGFDHERWLYLQQIDAKGYVRRWKGNEQIDAALVSSWIGRLRQTIASAIDLYTPAPQAAALLKALAVGDKRGIDQQAWQVFNATGTNHLMAISGLHVGLVAGWLLFIGSWLWRRSARLCLIWPALKAGALIALVGAVGYAALAGFTLPTQRALLMLVTTLGALILGFRVQFGRSLLLALFLVVLIDPLATLSIGFWLSFIAVAVILWNLGGRVVPLRGWRQGLRIQLAVTLGLLPVLFLFFGQVSLISPLVNLIMVPWFSMVLVPMMLVGLPALLIPELAQVWFNWLGTLSGVTFESLQWFSSLSFAVSEWPAQGGLLWLSALAGCLLLLMPGGVPGRGMGIWLCLPVILTTPERPGEGELWFTLLDVGQGLACVIETSNHLIVYDTGPKRGAGQDAAESVIIPFLKSRGHETIDLLLVSNGDNDHAGGFNTLVKAIPAERILAGEPELIEQAQPCRAGDSWLLDGISFQILHPTAEALYKKSNDRSCVLKVVTGDWGILLPGDIEKAGEEQLINLYSDQLKSKLLVAPHHGSNSSSSRQFVTAVDPEWVLFSTGYKNSYGFPKPEVIDRWRVQGAVDLNTALTGAIEFRIAPGEQTPLPRLYRALNTRYWHNRE